MRRVLRRKSRTPTVRERQMANASADPWLVYLLRCADSTLYTGITTDLKRRCQQHNQGMASRYTRGRHPVRLVYQESYPTKSLALRREAAIKALGRRAKESLIGSVG